MGPVDDTAVAPAAELSAEEKQLADIARRTEEARARKEATQQRIAASQRLKVAQLALESEERQAAEAEQLEGLVEKYGPVGKALKILRSAEGHMIVVRTPAAVHVKRFRSKKGFESPDAQDELAGVALAYPDKIEFAKLVDRWPFLSEQVCVLAIDLARAKSQEEAGE